MPTSTSDTSQAIEPAPPRVDTQANEQKQEEVQQTSAASHTTGTTTTLVENPNINLGSPRATTPVNPSVEVPNPVNVPIARVEHQAEELETNGAVENASRAPSPLMTQEQVLPYASRPSYPDRSCPS